MSNVQSIFNKYRRAASHTKVTTSRCHALASFDNLYPKTASGGPWDVKTLSPGCIWLGTMRPERAAGGVNRVGAPSTSHHRSNFPSAHFIERLPCSNFVS